MNRYFIIILGLLNPLLATSNLYPAAAYNSTAAAPYLSYVSTHPHYLYPVAHMPVAAYPHPAPALSPRPPIYPAGAGARHDTAIARAKEESGLRRKLHELYGGRIPVEIHKRIQQQPNQDNRINMLFEEIRKKKNDLGNKGRIELPSPRTISAQAPTPSRPSTTHASVTDIDESLYKQRYEIILWKRLTEWYKGNIPTSIRSESVRLVPDKRIKFLEKKIIDRVMEMIKGGDYVIVPTKAVIPVITPTDPSAQATPSPSAAAVAAVPHPVAAEPIIDPECLTPKGLLDDN